MEAEWVDLDGNLWLENDPTTRERPRSSGDVGNEGVLGGENAALDPLGWGLSLNLGV
jgi:hypothetical protein